MISSIQSFFVECSIVFWKYLGTSSWSRIVNLLQQCYTFVIWISYIQTISNMFRCGTPLSMIIGKQFSLLISCFNCSSMYLIFFNVFWLLIFQCSLIYLFNQSTCLTPWTFFLCWLKVSFLLNLLSHWSHIIRLIL